ILIAVSFLYNEEVNFDSLEELDDSYPAVHATNVISDNFDEGTLFPVEVILSNGDDLLTEESLSRLDAVASTVNNIEGVKEVQTLTRPSGEEVEDFSVRSQLSQASDSMDDMISGLEEISSGLSDTSDNLSESNMEGGDL